MPITGMTIGGIPPFTEPVEFEFDERVNVFIGPNGSGKSTAIRWLATGENTIKDHQERPGSSRFEAYASRGSPGNARLQIISIDEIRSQQPFIMLPATRILLPLDSDDAAIRELLTKRNDHRDLAPLMEDSMYIFDASKLYYASKIINEKLQTQSRDVADISVAEAIICAMSKDIADDCTRDVCGELLEDSEFADYVQLRDVMPVRTARVNREGIQHVRRPSSIARTAVLHNDMGVFLSQGSSDDGMLFLGDLSSGTQGTLVWIRYLALRIAYHYGRIGEDTNKPAILLIDEIENHLHPTWQRRVIPALLEHFPGLQIFATTHSPFVMAGLKAGQVHLLNRDESNVVTATTNRQDIVGWTADEILRTMMGVQDPTDDETARNAAALRQLRDEGPRATPEEEEQRQEDMQRLRRLVNRDLLAGGPREAQRELFEQQFGEALEKYLQSQDLNQDSG